ncbi:cell division protein SepF [Merismopedia glauca]|uniref:Cell division protein SepF n=1 Tax=Merismopedia glauca CCAP 1448/3 TaxID=1296344 RepID=A0A2T1BXK1_9CYAN|nr:cell division protein SepF [Merismopedia glauca]PSB00637.1 cell division protein SepF [Merismopedia glauca CCAP 1448/3]
MSSILNRLKDFVGLGDPVEYYDGDYEDEIEEPEAGYQNQYQESNPQSTLEEERNLRRRGRDRNINASESGEINHNMGNVIGMPGSLNGISEVMVMEPRSFEEMPQAIQALRERKTLVLNLTMMEPEQAQRAVDFVAGGTFAMDGHQERIGESIFLFTPNCVKVSTQDGTLHDVPQAPIRSQRVASPTPSWGVENIRLAQ